MSSPTSHKATKGSINKYTTSNVTKTAAEDEEAAKPTQHVWLLYQTNPIAKVRKAVDHTTPLTGGQSPSQQSRRTTLHDTNSSVILSFEPIADSDSIRPSDGPSMLSDPWPPLADPPHTITQHQSFARANDSSFTVHNALSLPSTEDNDKFICPRPQTFDRENVSVNSLEF